MIQRGLEELENSSPLPSIGGFQYIMIAMMPWNLISALCIGKHFLGCFAAAVGCRRMRGECHPSRSCEVVCMSLWLWEIRPTEQQNLNLLKPTYVVKNVESRKSRKINQLGWSNCAFDTDRENGLFSWVVGLVGGRFTQHNWSQNKFATYPSRTARWIWSSLLLVPHSKQMECISQICSYPRSSTSESRSEKHRPPTLSTL